MSIKITENGDTARLYTPYNPEFVRRIKTIGGAKWDSANRCWSVPTSAVSYARQIMVDVYGESDQPDTTEKTTVRLTFTESVYEYCGPVVILGRVIASARGRDSGARPGDGVVFVTGNPTSGGSAKNWNSVVPSGCVVDVHNVPVSKLDEELPDGVTLEVIKAATPDLSELRAEREKLLARLKEIDAILGN